MKALYTAQALATGDGRDGHVKSSDGQLDLDLALPKSLGGAGDAPNPELLFAAGYAACFHSALRLVGRRMKQDVSGSTVQAEVDIGSIGGGGFGLAVRLLVHLPALDDAAALQVAEAAHQVCPYSNATRGNIEVTLSVV
ncbi:MAG: organic hydroperoxide resistance protein [Myxococcota bacterium]|nr:organic hydroperoxide resistance protein [Myxococcota bacterium]